MKHKMHKMPSGAVRQESKLPFWLFIIVLVLLVAFGCGILIRYTIKNKQLSNELSLTRLEELWNSGDYQAVYEQTEYMLEQKPIQKSALVYRGYSCFYLAVSKTDTSEALNYIEDAINSLRIALISNHTKSKGQIEYMLAKAYFQKNNFASYNYYADLVVKYFLAAKADGFFANDIPETLGLAYAALDMTDKSISAFTEALALRESETLLNAIGEQYFKAGEYAKAKQYLFRIVTESTDDLLVLKSRNILGKIYLEENNLFDAREEFEAILEKDENYADAYYGLGIIHERQGDMIKARAEWRKALRVQANHAGAIQKLSKM